MAKKAITSKNVGSRWNQDELPILEWLSKKTKRKPSAAIKWAVEKAAEELGYIPSKDR